MAARMLRTVQMQGMGAAQADGGGRARYSSR